MLDVELGKGEVLDLASADAVARFFGRLGYRTETRNVQAAANLGLPADIERVIRRMELLADQDFFQVWLFELTSITVQITRRLALAFRNRPSGRFLLVLTTPDYDRLDFVLVELVAPDPASPGKQVLVRPRVLTVDRRDPKPLQLRVLRRLTFTEGDGFGQYDKLLSAYGAAEWSTDLFNNRALFSDYYLQERLPETGTPQERQALLVEFRRLFDDARRRLGGKKEVGTRAELLVPALRALGFDPREGKPPGDPSTGPDYRLYAPGGSKPLAFCLTFPWGRSLDGPDIIRDAESSDENPGAVVISLLEAGEAPWAIVTNGKLWRLYAAAAHSRATNYFEIDLEETLASATALEGFKIFSFLFRRTAFEPRSSKIEGQERTLSYVDEALLGSQSYAKALGERLKKRVFEEIFGHLAEGFVQAIRTAEGRRADLSDERLQEVFEGTLTLLYRLLFLFYAESRDLLPVRETRGYWEKSLTRLCDEIAERGGKLRDQAAKRIDAAFAPSSTLLYDRLSDLFRVVAAGDRDLNVPLYNGGLFQVVPDTTDASPEARNARFLSTWKPSDRFLAHALDLLARDQDDRPGGGLVALDYKSLGVRQLGSIYEGLLEFRVRLDERGAAVVANDRGERKATGSYYTPDFVVKYIVERTLGPIVDEHTERLRPKFRAVSEARRAAAGRREATGQKAVEDPATAALVDELFSITVLDPAMGSGHFLVEAVDRLTDRLLDFLARFPQNPVQDQIAQTRRAIVDEMERQGVSVDISRLTEVNLTKRQVLKRCIFGVDLNPMAVELAKVSLWLDSFTLGAPLSFLDHHLRCGNSLGGTTVEEVRAAASQRTLFERDQFEELASATALMRHVGELSDITTAQVSESRTEYRKAAASLLPYKRLLDLYCGQWFGGAPTSASAGRKGKKKFYATHPVVEFLNSGRARVIAESADPLRAVTTLPAADRPAVEAALAAAQRFRFFHWELEFPEVFFRGGRREPSAGFGVVIGNPPWIRQEGLKEMKAMMAATFPETFDAEADVYVHFLARGCRSLHPGGRLGMIVQNKWLKAGYAEKIRSYLAKKVAPLELVDFGHAPLFEDADTFPCVLVVHRPLPTTGVADDGDALDYCAVPREALPGINLPAYFDRNKAAVPRKRLKTAGWEMLSGGEGDLMERIRSAGTPLQEFVRATPFRGLLTGFNEAFILDQAMRDRLIEADPKSGAVIDRLLRGENVRRWHSPWDGEWLVRLESSENRDWPWSKAKDERAAEASFRKTYPALADWMKSHQARLKKRQDHGRFWWELRSCAYYSKFEKPKIIYQEIQFHSRFALDDGGHLMNAKAFLLPTDDLYVLAVLNSTVMWWFLERHIGHMKDEAYAMQGFKVEQLPIPTPGSSQRNDVTDLAKRLVALSKRRQEEQKRFLAWLCDSAGVEAPGRKIEEYWKLDAAGFEDAVRKKRTRPGTPADAQRAIKAFAKSVQQVRLVRDEAKKLEIDLQGRVFDLYGLSSSEVDLLRKTAPPRDPLALAESGEIG